MVVVLKAGTGKSQVEALADKLTKMGVEVNPVYGKKPHHPGSDRDTTRVDPTRVEAYPCVEKIIHVAEPFKKANRAFHPDDTVVDVSGVKIGGEALTIIAGPCSVESEEQICQVAGDVKRMGANLLRGGAFKPRTSPYAFQGLKYDGLKLLIEAREKTGMPIVSEIMSPADIDIFEEEVDLIQVGARNMQNFDLLRQLGRCKKPVLLKRGLSATIEEWLMSAEYICAAATKTSSSASAASGRLRPTPAIPSI